MYAKASKHVPDGNDFLDHQAHSAKFSAVCRRLNGCLPFGRGKDWSTTKENDDASDGTARNAIVSMIGVDETCDFHLIAERIRK